MVRHFIRVLCDIHCDWQGPAPDYRVFVAGELFTERTFNFTDAYLEEMLQIDAPAGEYDISVELVQPAFARLQVKNLRVDYGPGTIEGNKLRIKDEVA
jgi:hypothetical protein